MDGHRSYPDEHESRWYPQAEWESRSAEGRYGEESILDSADAAYTERRHGRYAEEERFRVPEPRTGLPDHRFDEPDFGGPRHDDIDRGLPDDGYGDDRYGALRRDEEYDRRYGGPDDGYSAYPGDDPRPGRRAAGVEAPAPRYPDDDRYGADDDGPFRAGPDRGGRPVSGLPGRPEPGAEPDRDDRRPAGPGHPGVEAERPAPAAVNPAFGGDPELASAAFPRVTAGVDAGTGDLPTVPPSVSGPGAVAGPGPQPPAAASMNQPTGLLGTVSPPLGMAGPWPGSPGGPAEPGVPAAPAGTNVYRARRPAVAVLVGLAVLVFGVPALIIFFDGLTADPISPSRVFSASFVLLGLPFFALGGYGLGTGAASLVAQQGARVWLRTPLVYLLVAIALFAAAGLAAS